MAASELERKDEIVMAESDEGTTVLEEGRRIGSSKSQIERRCPRIVAEALIVLWPFSTSSSSAPESSSSDETGTGFLFNFFSL